MARPSSPDSDCSYFRNGPWETEKSENEEISHPTGLRDRKRIQITIPCTRIVGMKREREKERKREGEGGEKEFQSILRLVTVLKSHDLRRLYPPGNGIAKDIATELTFSSRGHCSCHWTNQPPSQRERLSCLHGNSHQRRFASIAATGF